MVRPHVIIVGAGFTGCATAHDLALRGCAVTVVERGEIASGTSGRTHGLLHSGGRYCVTDHESAIECIEEDLILRRIAAQCIEPNGGLFIALDDDDLRYAERFLAGAAACGIPVAELTRKQALALEPNINPRLKAAFTVPDGTFDPLRLALAFAASAVGNGATFRCLHLAVLGKLAQGPAAYDSFVALAKNPVLVAGELLVVVAGLFHGLNGLRLVLTSFGVGVPYQKHMLYGVGVVVALAAAVFALRMFGGA